ncbi:MAG: ATP synthase F1 subunit epsilon [Rickettsiales bacterium]
MADAFHLQIISPAKVVIDAYVPMVEVPGVEGDFGVLPGHAPVFSMLRPGVITVQLGDGVERRFFAATGYADVSPTQCTVLSDHISDLADMTMAEAEEALVAARKALADADNDADRLAAEQLVMIGELLLAALQ